MLNATEYFFPLGLDSADLVSKLRAAHAADEDGTRSGIDVLTGGVGDMTKLGIYEAFKVSLFEIFIMYHIANIPTHLVEARQG